MSDNISTNTVFHFTKNIKNLESILKNDFYPQFSFEDIYGTILSFDNLEKAIPMVSFCDIPLSQVKKHIKTYGEYAIGLSKEWAIKKQINPVLYTYSNSDIANKIADALSTSLQREREAGSSEVKISNKIIFAIQYVKPYEGRLWRNGHWTKTNIRFYDEREWRYIPNFEDLNKPMMLKKEDSSKKNYTKILKKLNKNISGVKHLRLSFKPKDIKYIIVKKESEILPMLDAVINIKRDKFSYKDVQVLTTRIISLENIKENF